MGAAIASLHKDDENALPWRYQLNYGLHYSKEEIDILPQYFPLLVCCTYEDIICLRSSLHQRSSPNFLTSQEFSQWLFQINTTLDKYDSTCNNRNNNQSINAGDQLVRPTLQWKENYMEFLHHSFLCQTTSSTSKKLSCMEFLCAIIIGSKQIWQFEKKIHLLIELYEDPVTKQLKESDLMSCLYQSMQGMSRLTRGLDNKWSKEIPLSLNRIQIAQSLAIECFNSTSKSKWKTHEQVAQFFLTKSCLHQFLRLFSGEEIENPYTFKLFQENKFSDDYRKDTQRLLRRQTNAAILIQRNWRCQMEVQKYQQKLTQKLTHQHQVASKLQKFIKQWTFSRTLNQFAEKERKAFNGGVWSVGKSPCVGRKRPHGLSKTCSLDIIDYFTYNHIKCQLIHFSKTFSIAIDTNEQLYAWGKCLPCHHDNNMTNPFLSCLVPKKILSIDNNKFQIKQIACGLAHCVLLDFNGMLYTWGMNDHGQLGHGTSDKLQARHGSIQYQRYYDPRLDQEYDYLTKPIRVKYFEGSNDQDAPPIPVNQVVCGDFFSMALSTNGEVFTWGDGTQGQLGHELTSSDLQVGFLHKQIITSAFTFLNEPEPILGLSDVDVIQIASLGNHCVALTQDGRLFEWGNWGKRKGCDVDHAFVPVETFPELIPKLQLRQIAVGDHHLLAEGKSIWLTSTNQKNFYLAMASYSCSIEEMIQKEKLFGSQQTCIILGSGSCSDSGGSNCLYERMEDLINWKMSKTKEEEKKHEEEDTQSTNRASIWKRRVEPFEMSLQDLMRPLQVVFDNDDHEQEVDILLGKIQEEVYRHIKNRIVIVPRGKLSGLYLQIQSSSSSSDEAPDIRSEFRVYGSQEALQLLTSCGFTSHCVLSNSSSSSCSPLEKANGIHIIEINEQKWTQEGEEKASKSQNTKDFSHWILSKMTQHVLIAQENGALAVLLVFSFMNPMNLCINFPIDSGIYLPVVMIHQNAVALPNASTGDEESGPFSFNNVLSQLTSSMKMRLFQRFDTLPRRIGEVLTRQARGIIIEQNAQSIEMDGRTKGAPIFLTDCPHDLQDTKPFVAMISAQDSETLRARAYLSPDPAEKVHFTLGSSTTAPTQQLLVAGQLRVEGGGNIYAWGNGENGRLGLGSFENNPLFDDGYEALTDTVYRFVMKPAPIGSLAGIQMKQLCCGTAHSLALSETGQVYTWGRGIHGALGHPQPFEDVWIPKQIERLKYEKIVHLTANDTASAFLSEIVPEDTYERRRKEITMLKKNILKIY